MNRKQILRLCLIAFSLYLLKVGWDKVQDNVGMMLVYFLGLGIVAGLLIVAYVLPWFGDAVGTAVYSSGEKIKATGSAKAAAKMAQGDYEGAIEEHEKELAADPSQTFPIVEMAKICADKLADPQRAQRLLQNHLQDYPWSPDDAALLRFRLVDLQLHHFKDFPTTRQLLERIIADFPNTRHSANAHHKLHELEQAEYKHLTEESGRAHHRP
ncbi:tetratricopeptide repeat protein [Prosthecobacter dejongeii]|uniref:Tetratricopeptide (TPR) repeat protein n=1 Tax=Prosthecobacter dejongeii TaxID=48465 RepID=A0A7W7YHL9_9BACT|nr:hypothetical protein [Prosthecobacter dejongeii]MBB5036292.1 tetratricopeptide (TPR) repeat protein [Prosthecobacter dejongeii]